MLPISYAKFIMSFVYPLLFGLAGAGLFYLVKRYSLSPTARQMALVFLALAGLGLGYWLFTFSNNHKTWVLENESGAFGKAVCEKVGPDPTKDGASGCIAWVLQTRGKQPITKEPYDLVQPILANNQYFWVKKRGKYAYLDLNGNPITQFIYDDASNFGQHVALVKQGAQYFYIDKKGAAVETARFDEATFVSQNNELLAVRTGQRWGYVNTLGKLVVQPTYQEVLESRVDPQVIGIPVKSNGRWGFVDAAGKPTSEFKFSSIDSVFKKPYLAVGACLQEASCIFIGADGAQKDPRVFKSVTGPILEGSPGFAVLQSGDSVQVSLNQ